MLQQHLVQQLLQGTLQGQGSSSSITGAVTNNNSPCTIASTIANTTTTTNNVISSQFVPVQTSLSVQGIQFVIKVINPISKRDFKSYTIRLKEVQTITLKSLKEEILEQLGKNVVCFDLQFDVGYMMGAQKISFSETDNMGESFQKILNKGYKLWCEGKDSSKVRKRSDLDEEDNQDDQIRPRSKKPKISALEERNNQVLKIANQLKEKHGDKYNMVQYKFWAETLLNKQFQNWDTPPHGLIWGNTTKKTKPKTSETENMMKSVSEMALQIATAIKESPHKSSVPTTSSVSVGISPGRKIDMQGKLLQQLELVHNMFERGAITSDQFEKRRESVMKQLETLDE